MKINIDLAKTKTNIYATRRGWARTTSELSFDLKIKEDASAASFILLVLAGSSLQIRKQLGLIFEFGPSH